MTAVAIIPARGGSKRIPHKNRRLFHGRPIIEYSIEAAQKSGLFSEIFVSTDDEQTMDIAVKLDCYIHIRSTSHLNGDEAGTQEVAQDCLLNSASAAHDVACCIYPCAPMLDGSDLGFGLAVLKSVRLYRYVYVPGWFYWGWADQWMLRSQIMATDSLCLTPDPARWVDINDESDWTLAEKMYAARREMA